MKHIFCTLLAAMVALPVLAQAAKGDAVENFKGVDARPFDFTSRTVTFHDGGVMPIGGSGVSPVKIEGLGTYALTGDVCVKAVKAALESGVRLIDTAFMYGNEAEVGRAIRESGVPRGEVFVITKIYPSQFGNAKQAIDEAVRKLDIGYIDLMLLHHPGAGDVNAYHAMEDAVKAGKVRRLGLSNWYIKELRSFLPKCNIKPVLVQNEIHPYYQEQDVVPFIQSLGIVVQGWYPLGGRGYTQKMLADKTLEDIAKRHSRSVAQVILRWNLQRGVVVIPGSSNPEHIMENTQHYDFALTEDEMRAIAALDRGEKHDWY